jgi:hypothetical protein
MNEQEIYVSRVSQTALFFWEMFEENQGGHTEAIKLLKPTPKLSNVQLRGFVLNDLYRTRGLALTEAAVQLAAWLERQNYAPKGAVNIESAIRAYCAPYERDMRVITDDNEVLERSFVRLARYYYLMHAEEAGRHTRVPDYFIPNNCIPRGRSHSGTVHPEHVVPCAAIREYCLKYFVEGRSLDEVVKLIRRLLVIVDVSIDEWKKLDEGPSALKDIMPPEWDLETGCIFARLHLAEIKFDPPPGFTCGPTGCCDLIKI